MSRRSISASLSESLPLDSQTVRSVSPRVEETRRSSMPLWLRWTSVTPALGPESTRTVNWSRVEVA